MSDSQSNGHSGVSATYKARDVEEVIDIWFYRPIGYRIALAARALGLSPNGVTVLSIIVGVIGGHFFLYDSLAITFVGIGLWVFANMLDSADGQLARMTGRSTEFGRILDGFAGNLVFISIYFHICLRYALNDGVIGWWIFPIALLAGACHSLQSAMADYYRNAYLRFVIRGGKGELARSNVVREQYESLSWKGSFWRKFFVRTYLNYSVEQEAFAPKFQVVRDAVDRKFGGVPPDWFADLWRRLNKPLLKYYNFLTINGRVLTLFALVLTGYGAYFFVVEITAFNLLLWWVLHRQERNNERMLRELEERAPDLATGAVSEAYA